jgi:hypothetical protein
MYTGSVGERREVGRRLLGVGFNRSFVVLNA